MEQTALNSALALLSRAIADHDRAEQWGDHCAYYHASERWDFVRGARELLKLAMAPETDRAPVAGRPMEAAE